MMRKTLLWELRERVRPTSIGTHPREVLANEALFNSVQRAATRAAHPDAGGDNETFLRVREAIDVVKARFEKGAASAR